MTISFQCPSCGKPYNVQDEWAGRGAKCTCGAALTVPQPSFGHPASSYPQQSAAPQTPRDRGAVVRANLKRMWKPILALNVGWFVVTLVVCVTAITYAYSHRFSPQRVQSLGGGCGTAMAILLGIIWLGILIVASKKRC